MGWELLVIIGGGVVVWAIARHFGILGGMGDS
jgi:hypothetical protein